MIENTLDPSLLRPKLRDQYVVVSFTLFFLPFSVSSLDYPLPFGGNNGDKKQTLEFN